MVRVREDMTGWIMIDDDFKTKAASMLKLLGFGGYDHIDRNPLNNQKNNFREATKSQQCINRNKFKNNTSGYIGVSWVKRDEKWKAYIQSNGAMIYLGYYSKKENAIIARLQAENKYFGEFAPQKTYLNNIKSISRGNVADDLLR